VEGEENSDRDCPVKPNWKATMTATFATLSAAARQCRPVLALGLGSGLGPVVAGLNRLHSVSFGDVPGLAASSVIGHRGAISYGDWLGRPVLVFEGRLHYYEGHPWEKVTALVRVGADLGTRRLVLTNAAGGIRDDLNPGTLMAITDHIEWTRPYCWREPGPGGLGSARASAYSSLLLTSLRQAAVTAGVALSRGVYGTVTGPCYETPAEIRALRAWGADAVGMSTAREVQLGHDLGLECAAISCITNKAAGLSGGPLNHEEVLHTAAAQADRLRALLEAFLTSLP
jgi:purine-nucleoside phosphorylase